MDNRLEEFQRLLSKTSQPVELLLAQMPPEQARALRLCAIPHDFDAGILRALLPELSEATAAEFCATFTRLSLIATREDSFAMHDEPRRFLFERWLDESSQEEFRAASERLVGYFSERGFANEKSDAAESATRNRMFHLLGANRAAGRAEFERLIRDARQQLRLGECETLIKLAHEYDRVLDSLDQATLAYHEGKLAADRQRWQDAGKFFERVLATDEISPELRAKTLCRLGMIHHAQRDWKTAIEIFQRGLHFCEPRPECARQFVHLHLNLGSTLRDSGQFAEAEKFLRKGIALAEKLGDVESLADGYNSLGALYLKLGDSDQAIAAFKKSLSYLDQLGDKFRRAQVYNNLGNAYADRRDWEKSQQFFQRSLEIKRLAGDNAGQGLTLINLVRVYRAQQQTAPAIAASEDAARLFAEVRDFYNVGIAKRTLARIYRATGETAEARRLFEEAAEFFSRADDTTEASATRDEVSELARKRGVPWWIYLAIALFIALVIAFAVAVCYVNRNSRAHAGTSFRAPGRWARQYSSPFFETRNSSDGSLNSVAPQIAHL